MTQDELDPLLEAFNKIGLQTSYCPLDDFHLGKGQGMDWLKKVPLEKRHSVMGAIHAMTETFLWAGLNGFELKVGAPPNKLIGVWYSSVSGQDDD